MRPAADTEPFDLEARSERLAGNPLAAAAGMEIFRNFDQGFTTGLQPIIAGIGNTLLP